MKKVNVALLTAVVAIFIFGCNKPPGKIAAEYEMGSTSFSRLLDDPPSTRISTTTGDDVTVLGHHHIAHGKKVIETFYDNDDKYVCIYGEKNCWKTPDSNGSSPYEIPNKYVNGKKK